VRRRDNPPTLGKGRVAPAFANANGHSQPFVCLAITLSLIRNLLNGTAIWREWLDANRDPLFPF
jgi:hypothetical protein